MGGQFPTQVLAHQLTLSQPEGADCTPQITTFAHPALGSFLRPCRWSKFCRIGERILLRKSAVMQA